METFIEKFRNSYHLSENDTQTLLYQIQISVFGAFMDDDFFLFETDLLHIAEQGLRVVF